MNSTVESKRILHTPSKFAKESLLYLQEVGESRTLRLHTNKRNRLNSFLFFVVLKGNGEINYEGKTIPLEEGNCVFINCNKQYSHTSDNWSIAWIHFNGFRLSYIYDKYIERNGKNSFKTRYIEKYKAIIYDTYQIAESDSYIQDIEINEKLSSILTLLMSETVYSTNNIKKHKYNINDIKTYIDENYTNSISLDGLSSKFFINKFYLTRLFKDTYGKTINGYIIEKKITKAKELLRFSDLNIDEISINCGISDPNYFSRLFKSVEGITPKEYQNMW